MFDFMPGKVCAKLTWVVVDHTDDTMWVYHVDGSTLFVGTV